MCSFCPCSFPSVAINECIDSQCVTLNYTFLVSSPCPSPWEPSQVTTQYEWYPKQSPQERSFTSKFYTGSRLKCYLRNKEHLSGDFSRKRYWRESRSLIQKESNLLSLPMWQHFCILLSLTTWFVSMLKGPPPCRNPWGTGVSKYFLLSKSPTACACWRQREYNTERC